ncbi:hypothetical protein AMECASPLE_003485 [Ameca splendens]|uniref:Uncharacterized protein n=1 Tax=Ameca splendens TaxID=208324 RepID=A0ABV0YWN3_9TELE
MSEEEEGPGVATSTSTTQLAATTSRITTAIAKGSDGVVLSSPPCRPSLCYHLYPEEKEAEDEEKGIIQEERIEEEEKELKVVEERDGDDEDEDDGSSDTSVLVVPYPELVPVVFFCLKQTTCPRSLCIRMVCSPYPLSRIMLVMIVWDVCKSTVF